MSTIEELRDELEAAASEWADGTVEDYAWPRLVKAVEALTEARAAQAEGNALYGMRGEQDYLVGPFPLREWRRMHRAAGLEPLELHQHDGEKYTGKVITGDELAKLLRAES